jgi:hypothetical protein
MLLLLLLIRTTYRYVMFTYKILLLLLLLLLSIRSDSIRFDPELVGCRSDANLVPTLPDFELASIGFYFNSIRLDLHLV